MVIGYPRVSTLDQHPEQQIGALEKRGCGKIFIDRRTGGAPTRPQLAAALAFLRKGDTLAVWKFDRLARNTQHLLALAAELDGRGCQLASLIEAIDTGSPGAGWCSPSSGMSPSSSPTSIASGRAWRTKLRAGPASAGAAPACSTTRTRSGLPRNCCATRACRAPARSFEDHAAQVVPGLRPRSVPGKERDQALMTLQDAFEAYLADVRARNLSSSSVRGYRSLFRALKPFAEARGIGLIGDVDAGFLRVWRESWTWAPTTHR